MTSLCVMTLLRMPHCGITVGNSIARDMHCDITMGNDAALYTYHGITMHKPLLLGTTTPNCDIAVSPVNSFKFYT